MQARAAERDVEEMSFKDIALALAKRDIPVIPVQPFGKDTYLPGGEERGSLLLKNILAWDAENPDYNVGCLGTAYGVTILDCDVPGLMTRIEQETGQKCPATFTVKSAGKGCAHFYFRQTDASRRLGNKKGDGLFDLRGNNHYVVGPGSALKLSDGTIRKYSIWRDAPIAEFPEWLEEWILANSSSAKGGATGDVDQDSYRRLRKSYLENLNPQDMLGLPDLTIESLHPTLHSLACLLHDGHRTEDDVAEILEKLAGEYGHRQLRGRGEIESIAQHAFKKAPTEFTLPEGHPELTGFSDGLVVFATEALLKEHLKERLYAEYTAPAETEEALDIKTAEWFFDADAFLGERLPPRRALASDNNGTPLLFEKSLNQIFAFRGQGKTMFTHGLINILIHGGEFLRYKSDGGCSVLIADGELPDIQLQERVKRLIGPTAGKLKLMSPDRMPGHTFPKLSDPAWQEEFLKRTEILKPDIIVFDTLTACFRFDTNDPDVWLQVNQFFIALRIKGYCVIVVHHAGKSGTQRGRTDGDDNLDLSIKLEAPKGWGPGDGLELAVSYEKVRAGGNLPGFQAAYNNEANSWDIVASEDDNEAVKMLIAGKSVRSIASALDISKSSIWRLKKQAEKNGVKFPPPRAAKRKKDEEDED